MFGIAADLAQRETLYRLELLGPSRFRALEEQLALQSEQAAEARFGAVK
jgi:hypothetical protein